jgi:hypothetical protein
MRPPTTRSRSKRLCLTAVGVAGAGLVASAVTAAVPASAAGLNLLPSTTTLSATAAENGSGVTFTETTKVLGLPGLGVLPNATIAFVDNHGTTFGLKQIGGNCLLKTCTASLFVPTDAFAYQDEIVTARFPGDLLAQASSASVELVTQVCEDPNADDDANVRDNDVNNDNCATPRLDSADQTTDAYVESASTSGQIIVTLGGPALPCSLGVADIVNVTGSGLNADKSIQIFYNGAAALAYNTAALDTADLSSGHSGYMCYSSPNPWVGFSSTSGTYHQTASDFAHLGTVPQVGGEYVGLLADCNYFDSPDSLNIAAPCLAGQSNDGFEGSSIDAPASDPHLGG